MSSKKKRKSPCSFQSFASSKKPSKNSIYSSNRSKIEDEGKEEPADPDSQESWSNNCCRQSLARNLVKSVSCRFCHADVTLLENVSASSGLGSCWIVSCENKHCPPRNLSENFLTNFVARAAEFRSCKCIFY